MAKSGRLLKVGILGCGPVAQAAHLESALKAENACLYAICDAAEDLVERMAATYSPVKSFLDYDEMLADSEVEAVIVATADAFHVPASMRALRAGKHVLCEKPLGTAVEEVEELKREVERAGRVLQVGHMKRFDAGVESAREFIRGEMGEALSLKAWYCDSTHRYTVTDAVQPYLWRSAKARRPEGDPKADRARYNLLTHGSHLLDTARFLGGEILEVRARLRERFGAWCWFVEAAFASGALGHLELTVAVRMDWHEGFEVFGEHGSVMGKMYNPWLYKTSEVEIFHEGSGVTTRVLGADGHFYRRQLEGFARTILEGAPMAGADIDDGIAAVRGMAAIAQSVRSGGAARLAEAAGSV